MAKAIKDATIGLPLRAAPDYIFNEADITTAGTSDEFYAGNTQNAVEIVIEADTDIVTAATTGAFQVDYLYGDTFAESITLVSAGAAETITAGEIYRFVPPAGWLESAGKIQVTQTDATGTISVFPIYISR